MADTVEFDAGAAVEIVANKTIEMSQRASEMANSASSVGNDCQDVAIAANKALENAETVAAATEQLSASIREIGLQISTASQVTGSAVISATRSRQTIERLSSAVTRIDQVAKLINDIASQTNLLALNATIEAARAGDAGKGFAVVANEVKNLANQTAKATEEITAQIADIQNATDEAVASVSRIVADINNVNDASAAIAAAVDEQGAATNEISRNVDQTKDAANEVASKINRVSQDASSTGQSASSVSIVTEEVAEAILNLRESLIRTIRTASPETDRRQETRLTITRKVKVGTPQGEVEGVVLDISKKGIKIKGQADIPPRSKCTVILDDVEVRAEFTETKNGIWRFKVDPKDEAKVLQLISSYQPSLQKRKAG
jgi:methyl-accepting chemotaxis protein